MKSLMFVQADMWEKIFIKISEGQSLRSILKENKSLPCSVTIFRYIERDDSLKAAYQKAVEMRAETLAEDILDLSDEEVPAHLEGSGANAWVQRQRLRVDARKWTASKLKPRTYGDNLQVQVTDERISVIDALQAAQARLLKNDDVTDVEAL
jgi:hypothetical protein